ncbi:MAG: PAP2 family protein [Bacteroidota bacterium]
MGKFFAKLFSFLFHPLLMPAIGVIILFNSGSILEFLPFEAKKIIFIIVLISTTILPLTFLPFFIFQKIIKSIYMESNKERLVPFFITSILYFFSYYLLIRLGAPKTINVFMLASATSVFLLFLLSIKWKISAHMLGIGGLTGALIAVSFRLNINIEFFIIAAILVSGVLGYSRLKLEKHNQFDVYAGWFTGLMVTALVISVY